jgi:hypothetical protein
MPRRHKLDYDRATQVNTGFLYENYRTANTAVINLLLENNVFKEAHCPECEASMKLGKKGGIDKFQFVCYKHQSNRPRTSIRADSILSGSTLSAFSLLLILYHFVVKSSHSVIISEVGCSQQQLTRILKYVRAAIFLHVTENPISIGGEGWIVEIDEVKKLHCV